MGTSRLGARAGARAGAPAARALRRLTPSPVSFQSLVIPEKFQHILRVLNTNIDGRRKIAFAITAIKVGAGAAGGRRETPGGRWLQGRPPWPRTWGRGAGGALSVPSRLVSRPGAAHSPGRNDCCGLAAYMSAGRTHTRQGGKVASVLAERGANTCVWFIAKSQC